MYNVDGTANEVGSICEVIDVVLRYRDHAEHAKFSVTGLGNQDMILGYSWLREHNPEVDWSTGEVKMSRCPGRCSTCRMEIKQERHKHQAEVRHLRSCRAGSMPTIEEIFEDPPEFPSNDSEADSEAEFEAEDPLDNPDEIEPGDRVFMTTVHDPVEFIQATATTFQRLAEAFTRNSAPPKSFRESVPSQFHDFEDVFSKLSFDALLDRKPWDHAIELELGAKASSTKVYPLSPNKQTELDAFIEENLASGRIHPSKSPMAAPVFFIKKKDGSLRLVQDYQALNVKTVKNAYPLPLISNLINQLRGVHYFTKLDVWWGYNKVCIKEGDESKAAFHTNQGPFEPLVMFFGLTNSPATFQTMMNEIFQDLISEGVLCVYLDDILIFTETMEEHDRVTHLVLEWLQQYKLYL
jgi:Reverse transcriptase (RNA-dependent DNA polymerase)